MPEIGTSVSMSGDGKRSVGHRPQATAPVLDSTRPIPAAACASQQRKHPRPDPLTVGLGNILIA